MFYRATSEPAGGIRFDWLPKVAKLADNGVVQGLFAEIAFPPSTNPDAFALAIGQAGLELGLNALTAIPIGGPILRAAVGVGAFFAKLLRRKPKERELRVAWQEYSKATDEDVVNTVVSLRLEGVDWTDMLAPALDSRRGWSLEKTRKGGPTRAWATFNPGGELAVAGGLGMLPGTQRLTQAIQVATVHDGPTSRIDAITDVGSFWPSTTQFWTGAWEMVSKLGNPDMFKVGTKPLLEAWAAYFDSMFADAFSGWDSMSLEDQTYLSKALGPFIVAKPPGTERARGLWSLGLDLDWTRGPFVTPKIFSDRFAPPIPGTTYGRIDSDYVLPALRRLRKRQIAALQETPVCALVRPRDVDGQLQAYAAFRDDAGLADLCVFARAALLTHPARYKLAAPDPSRPGRLFCPDVRVADPPYAERLEATLVGGLPLKARIDTPLMPDAEPAPDAEPPGGGPVWPMPSADTLRRWVFPGLAAAGLGGAVAAALLVGD